MTAFGQLTAGEAKDPILVLVLFAILLGTAHYAALMKENTTLQQKKIDSLAQENGDDDRGKCEKDQAAVTSQ